jgi:hypothetical protein
MLLASPAKLLEERRAVNQDSEESQEGSFELFLVTLNRPLRCRLASERDASYPVRMEGGEKISPVSLSL